MVSSFLVAIFFSSCALWSTSDQKPIVQTSSFGRGQALVQAREFQKALPFLTTSLKERNEHYADSLLLLARAYDQMGEPEKAILSLQEYITHAPDTLEKITALSLLLKNYSKAGLPISHLQERQDLDHLIKTYSGEPEKLLNSLKWSMEMNCDQLCLSEVLYMKEIQIQYLYMIEKDADVASAAADTVWKNYQFFQSFLYKEHLSLSFRNQIAAHIVESAQRLDHSFLPTTLPSARRSAKLVYNVQELSKKVEGWLYR